MSKLGQQIKANQPELMLKAEVPEWGQDGVALVLYSTPLLCGEFNRIQRKHPDFLNNMTIEALVDLIILKACDAAGEKCFDIEDKQILMRQPVSIVTSVSNQLMGEIASVEDAEKN
jgi:hypothetical protein